MHGRKSLGRGEKLTLGRKGHSDLEEGRRGTEWPRKEEKKKRRTDISKCRSGKGHGPASGKYPTSKYVKGFLHSDDGKRWDLEKQERGEG